MKARVLCSGVLLGLALGLVLAPSDVQSQPAAKPADGTLAALQRQRRDVLKQLVDALQKEYRSGHTSLDVVVEAHKRLLDAELELAIDRKRRIALRREQVELLKSLHNEVQARVKMGVVGISRALEAKAAVIEAEIDLHREQSRNGEPQ